MPKNSTSNTFTENLKFFRKLNDFTQDTVSSILQVKRCTYASYEEGRAEPSIEIYLKICKLYKIRPEDFYKKDFSVK